MLFLIFLWMRQKIEDSSLESGSLNMVIIIAIGLVEIIPII